MRGSACNAAVYCTAVSILLVLSCEAAPEPSTDDEVIAETGGATNVGAGGGANSAGVQAGGGAPATEGAGGKSASGGGGSGGATGSGGASSAGTAGSGGASGPGAAGSGGSAGGAPHEVGKCDSLPKPGTWEQITPPEVLKYLPPQGKGSPDGNLPFGVQAIGLDPTVDGTVYLGTCKMGLWKSTDCGSTWARINTGKNGATLDLGAQNSMVIDPLNPKIIYTNSFYGQNGAFKSTDGGVNWEQFWPPADPALSKVVAYNFVGTINMTHRITSTSCCHSTRRAARLTATRALPKRKTPAARGDSSTAIPAGWAVKGHRSTSSTTATRSSSARNPTAWRRRSMAEPHGKRSRESRSATAEGRWFERRTAGSISAPPAASFEAMPRERRGRSFPIRTAASPRRGSSATARTSTRPSAFRGARATGPRRICRTTPRPKPMA